eukprot:7518380-Pyramimonas_sp.AAC.2
MATHSIRCNPGGAINVVHIRRCKSCGVICVAQRMQSNAKPCNAMQSNATHRKVMQNNVQQRKAKQRNAQQCEALQRTTS